MPPLDEVKQLLSRLPGNPELSEILQEVGQRSCLTLETFKELILQAHSPLTEVEVAKCILLVVNQKEDESASLARLSLSNNSNSEVYQKGWNLEVFVRGLSEAVSFHQRKKI